MRLIYPPSGAYAVCQGPGRYISVLLAVDQKKKKTNTLPSVGSLTDRLMQQFKDLENRDGDSRAVTDIELMKRNEWKMGRARKGNLCVGGERMDVVLVYSPLGQMRPRTIVNMIKHASQFFTYKQGPGPHIY